MPLEVFNTAALSIIDGGRIRTGLDLALKRVCEDCNDRPFLKKSRKVTLEIEITPVPDGEGLDSCSVEFKIRERIPARSSKSYNMRAGNGGGLLFNELSPEDVDQGTIPMGVPKGDQEKKGTATNAR
jgi:hypothetical protein